MKTQIMMLGDKLDELNFETQDAMYQLTLAETIEDVNEIKDSFSMFLESFVASIVDLAKNIKDEIVRAMKRACNMFLNMYKARVAVIA